MAKVQLVITSVLVLFLGSTSEAAALKLASLKVGPVTYNDVSVIGANVTDLYFTHAAGIGNVKLKYVNAELQKKFNFNPKVAADAEKKQAESEALYQASVISNIAYQTQQARICASNANIVVESFADPISDKSLIGKAAPALDIEKWLEEKPETEGKFVLVSFWAPWSTASTRCIPDLNAYQKKFAKQLVVLGITPSEELEGAPKLGFVCGVDSKAKVSTAAGVSSVPCVLLIDPKGIVRYQGHPAALNEKKLELVLAKTSE